MNTLVQVNPGNKEHLVPWIIDRRWFFWFAVVMALSACTNRGDDGLIQIQLDKSWTLWDITDYQLQIFLASVVHSPYLPWRKLQKRTLNFRKKWEWDYEIILEKGENESYTLTLVRSNSGADFTYVYNDMTHTLSSRHPPNLLLIPEHLSATRRALRENFPGF